MTDPYIYRLLAPKIWDSFQEAGIFTGTAIDHQDGYLHFSAAAQVQETARLYYAGHERLILVQVSSDACGEALKWDVSRDGARFPHLYATLPLAHVARIWDMNAQDDGGYDWPDVIRMAG